MNKKKYLSIIIIESVIIVGLLALLVLVFLRENYPKRLFYKYGLIDVIEEIDDTSLARTFKYLDCDADVVFMGDSITIGHDFNKDFSDKTIVNIGKAGDDLEKIKSRVGTLKYLSPEKVFIMGGINGMTPKRINNQINIYRSIIESIKTDLPDAKIYIESVLPVSDGKHVSNDDIDRFNVKLENLCTEMGVTYIDLHGLYEIDGHMKDELTKDGLHLHEEGYKNWIDEITQYIYE